MPKLYYYMNTPKFIYSNSYLGISKFFYFFFIAMNIVNIPIPKLFKISLEHLKKYLEFI